MRSVYPIDSELKKITVEIGNHGYGGTNVSYYLQVGEESVALSDEQAEEIMLGAGIGTVLYEPDFKTNRIRRRIKGVCPNFGVYETWDEAAERLKSMYTRELNDVEKRLSNLGKGRYS